MKIRLLHPRKQGLTHTESLVSPSAGSARVLFTSPGPTIVRVVPIKKVFVRCVARRSWTPKTTSRRLCDFALIAFTAPSGSGVYVWGGLHSPLSTCSASSIAVCARVPCS